MLFIITACKQLAFVSNRSADENDNENTDSWVMCTAKVQRLSH